jgi:hypothetical protein
VAISERPYLLSYSEARGEKLWQTSGTYKLLRSRNVVRNASPRDGAERTNCGTIVAAIPQDPTCARVAIARLPNRTNVDQCG